MTDQRFRVGAPSAPLTIKLGGVAYEILLHDNGEGSYGLRAQAADGSWTDLAATFAELNLASGETGDLYTLPATGIPEADMAAAVSASLGLADSALQSGALVADLAVKYLQGSITLNGVNPTQVVLGADAPAQILGTEDEPFALSNGLTLVVDPDGAGDETVTFAAAAGTSAGNTGTATDLSASTDTKLKIAYNGAAAVEVTFDWATGDAGGPCNDGTKTAAELQEKIRAAIAGNPAITVAFGADKYTITSPTAGTGSSIVITNATADNCADDLKLGVANGGTETAGTGDAVNIAAATAAEVAAAITAAATGWTGVAVGTKVQIVSDTDGKDSSLVVNAASTADTVLGITGSDYGAQGLGYSTAIMDNTAYVVMLTPGAGQAALADVALGVTGKATGGFNVECETAASTIAVDLLIVGAATIA